MHLRHNPIQIFRNCINRVAWCEPKSCAIPSVQICTQLSISIGTLTVSTALSAYEKMNFNNSIQYDYCSLIRSIYLQHAVLIQLRQIRADVAMPPQIVTSHGCKSSLAFGSSMVTKINFTAPHVTLFALTRICEMKIFIQAQLDGLRPVKLPISTSILSIIHTKLSNKIN